MNIKNMDNQKIIASLFAEAQPIIPDTISAEAIEYKIISKQKHHRIKFEQNKNFKPLIAAAACFALIIGMLSLFNPLSSNADKARNFKNEQELNSFISELKNGSSSELGAGSEFFPQIIYTTNDLKNHQKSITSNGKYIFYAYYDSNNDINRNKIYIFNTDKENPQLINIFSGFTDDSKEISSVSIFQNNLAVTFSDYQNTETQIYDVTDPLEPTLKAEFSQSGSLPDTYMIDNTLYITTFYGTAHDNAEGLLPENEYASVKPKNIYRFDDAEYINFIVIGAVNIKSCRRTEETKAVLGAYYEKQFSDECLYLTNGNYNNPKYIKYNLKSGKAKNTEIDKIDIRKNSECKAPLLIKTSNNTLLSFNTNDNGTEVRLYNINDKNNPAVLDNKILNGIYCNFTLPAFINNNSCLFTYYKSDEYRRYYGAVQLKTENNKISSEEYTADSDRIMEADICIAINDYIYTIYQPDAENAEIYSFKNH